MEMVEGNIYWEPTLPEYDNELRNKIYREKINLADSHKLQRYWSRGFWKTR